MRKLARNSFSYFSTDMAFKNLHAIHHIGKWQHSNYHAEICLQVVFPHKKLSFRILDTVILYGTYLFIIIPRCPCKHCNFLLFYFHPLRFVNSFFFFNTGKAGHSYCNRSVGIRCQLQIWEFGLISVSMWFLSVADETTSLIKKIMYVIFSFSMVMQISFSPWCSRS